jgi:hypothetical protein
MRKIALLLGVMLVVSCAEREGPVEPKDAFTIVASVPTIGPVNDLVVDDGWAFIATGELGLTTVDVHNPEAPLRVGHLDVPNGYAKAIATVTHGDRSFAFIAAGSYLGCLVAEITNPGAPTFWGAIGGGTVDVVESFEDVAAVDTMLYVADRSGGLASFGITEIAEVPDPHLVHRLKTDGYARGVAILDTVIFVAQGEAGLMTAHRKPDNFSGVLEPLDTFDTSDYANDVVAGKFGNQVIAFVADDARGIWVLDATDPANLTQIGWHRTPGNAKQVKLHGNRLLVADSFEGVLVLDVSRPDRPFVVGQYLVDSAWCVEADDDYIYVGTTENGLVILSW